MVVNLVTVKSFKASGSPIWRTALGVNASFGATHDRASMATQMVYNFLHLNVVKKDSKLSTFLVNSG